jgi:hypothetical protein
MLDYTLKGIVQLVRFLWRPLALLILVMLLVGMTPLPMSVGWVLIWGVLAAVAIVELLIYRSGSERQRFLLKRWSVYIATWDTVHSAFSGRRARSRGTELLVSSGLVSEAKLEEHDYGAWLFEDKKRNKYSFYVGDIPGIGPEDVRKACVDVVAPRLVGENARVEVSMTSGLICALISPTVAFPAMVPYPGNPRVSIDAIPIGMDEQGHIKTMPLRENAILCAGSPGSGKSGFLNVVCEGAVRCGNVQLLGVDLKRVELSNWSSCFDTLAVTLDDAISLLESTHNLMEERYRQLEQEHLRKVERFDSRTPLVLLVIDEAAALLTGGDKKKNEHAKELLRSIISLGRAAGVTVVFASQRVSANIISSDIRDIAKTRVSYSVTNIESAKMVLGDGLKADEQGPWRIGNSPAERGVCYMQDEADRSLVCVKTFWLDDRRIQDTVRRYGKPSPAMRKATREVPDVAESA